MQKLYSNQLGAALAKGLAPVYLVFGEEPLQKMEALDEIRATARARGFSERQSFVVEGQFDWSDCLNEFSSLSLFSDRKVIDIDIGTSKPTPATQDALKQIAGLLHPDVLLVVHASKNATEFAKQPTEPLAQKLNNLIKENTGMTSQALMTGLKDQEKSNEGKIVH